MVDRNPAISLASYRGLKLIDRALENHVLKTIDNDRSGRGLLSFRHLEMF